MRSLTGLCLASAAACSQADGHVVKAGDDRSQLAGVERVGTVAGFRGPEAVRYDPDQDAYFISNIVGFGSEKDGKGYITRIPGDDLEGATLFAVSGRDGVVLDAPKGMAIQGDTLWVADIDVVRGIHRRTGAPVGMIDFRPFGITMLNDIATGPDGTLRVTDTGILMTDKGVLRPGGDKIFRVGPGRSISIVAQGEALGEPNGITWHPGRQQWITVGFKRFNARVSAFNPGFDSTLPVAASGGQFDGVEVLPSGAIVYTCWTDSSVHVVHDGRDERLIRFVPEAADIGYDSRRGILAVPLVMMDRVEFYTLRKELTVRRE